MKFAMGPALALLTTGDGVLRDRFYNGQVEAEPGAIVCRVAESFLRFGHFELLAICAALSCFMAAIKSSTNPTPSLSTW